MAPVDPAMLDLLARAVSTAFLFAFGACVGSFLNVVAFRLPEGISVIHPPSRCPTCGGRLAWRDNLPILGWLLLRGRCRFCREPISVQYPLVELLTALLFAGLYLAFFAVRPGSDLAGWLGPDSAWWHYQGFARAWPAFVAILVLVGGLIAATLADLRTFLIPMPITRTVAIVALVAWAIQPAFGTAWRAGGLEPLPIPAWPAAGAAIGGFAGTMLALFLKARGTIAESFADYHEFVGDGDSIVSYPHARREMVKEAIFLAPTVVGLGLGYLAVDLAARGGHLDPAAAPPAWLALAAASMLGFLVGGGLVWFFRMAGTIVRGIEAMGLGDVHLLAAIGATLGWKAAIWSFALAPFPALLVELLKRSLARTRVARTAEWIGQPLPYGPYLAATALLVLLLGASVGRIERFLFADPVADLPARLERLDRRPSSGAPAAPPLRRGTS